MSWLSSWLIYQTKLFLDILFESILDEPVYISTQEVKFDIDIQPAHEYKFSVGLEFPKLLHDVGSKQISQERKSEKKSIKCLSKPTKISGNFH